MNPNLNNRGRLLCAGLTAAALTGLGVGAGVGPAHAATRGPAPTHTCDGRSATIVGTDGDDTITAPAGTT